MMPRSEKNYEIRQGVIILIYYEVLERAITYIEENLCNEVSAEDVAVSTGYSRCHLTRLFLAVLGESLSNYIIKRRMTIAAKDLLDTDKRVIDIAIEIGFQSSEAFSRAFKVIYGVSPVNYRKKRQDLFIGSKKIMEPELIRHIDKNITKKPRIEFMQEMNIAGLRGEISLKNNQLPKLWDRFRRLQDQIPDPVAAERVLGVCDTDLSVYDEDGNVMFRHIVGTAVSKFENTPGMFVKKTLKAGRYAVFTHTGCLSQLEKTYDYIWGTWLLSTKEKLDSRADFELYDHRFRGFDSPDTQIDIYIPIQ